MSMTVAPHLNLDTISKLDSNKQYFLSSSTGRVKEAGLWMRFKCAIGVASARQKVANLVDAVRSTLLSAAGLTGNATLDTDIKTVDLTSMVKGSVIKDIANRFSSTNSETVMKGDAAKVAKRVGNQIAARLSMTMLGIGMTKVVGSIVEHALKPMINDTKNLPTKTVKDSSGNTTTVLDKSRLETKMFEAAGDIQGLIKSIANNKRLGSPNIDKNYAKHIIDTLFNEDGTRNDKTIDDLKTPLQLKVDIAFKFNQIQNVSFEHTVHKTLKENGIDPEKKVAELLKLCDGDRELEEMVLDKVPVFCANANQVLRTEERTKSMFANLKDALAEIREVAKGFPGCAQTLKGVVATLGSTPIPKGFFRNIANVVKNAKIDKLENLTSLSSADAIYEGIEQLRLLTDNVGKEIDIPKAFRDAGEDDCEIGGPHMNAARVTTIALALAKAGPALLARLPNVINGTEFQKMSSVVTELRQDLANHFQIPGIEDSDTAKEVLENQDIMLSFLQSCVSEGLGIEIPEVPTVEVDTKADYVSNMLYTLETAVERG